MNRPQYILQPVNPYFITFSLAAAFLLNLMPWGRLIGVPDFVALVLLFWNVHQPRKVGMGIAFMLGILMDGTTRISLANTRWPTRCFRTARSRFIAACCG